MANPAAGRPQALSPRFRPEEYTLLQTLYHAPHLIDGVSRQLSVEDFADTELRDIYALLLRLRLQRGVLSLAQLPQEASEPPQAEILAKMALEPTPAKPEEVQQAVEDCVLKIRQRQAKVKRQHVMQQMRSSASDSVVDDRLLQEYSQLRKENPAN